MMKKTDILRADDPGRRFARLNGLVGSWGALGAGLALAIAMCAPGQAATPDLEGQWVMSPNGSSFQEAATGPAPDGATMTVTRDDRGGLAYELVESRAGSEVARAAYDLSFDGGASRSLVQGSTREITAARDTRGGVVIQAPAVGGWRALIRIRMTSPDTAVVEHEIDGEGRVIRLETISLVRSDVAADTRTSPPGPTS